MGRTLTIFKKEFIDVTRDRRTILTMVVMPLLFVPVLLTITLKVTQRQQEKADLEMVNIAFIGEEYAPRLQQAVEADSQLVIKAGVAEADVEALIRNDSLDGAIVVPPDFPVRVASDEQASIGIYYRSSSSFAVGEVGRHDDGAVE